MSKIRSNAGERAIAILLILLSLSALTLALSIGISNIHTMNALTVLTILGTLFVAVISGIFSRFKWSTPFLNPIAPEKKTFVSKVTHLFKALFGSGALSMMLTFLIIVGTFPIVHSEMYVILLDFIFSYGLWIGMIIFFPFSYKYVE